MPSRENPYPVYEVEALGFLKLPAICVSCGRKTNATTRVDVGAGDRSTEASDALTSLLPVPILWARTVRIPCCKRCSWKLKIQALVAFAMFPLGMVLAIPSVDPAGMYAFLPESVRSVLFVLGILGALGGPVIWYAVARHRRIPVIVSALKGGRYRYVFLSHIYKNVLGEDPEFGAEPDNLLDEGRQPSR